MRKMGCTEMITLGQIGGEEIGIQLELVKSALGKDPLIIVGMTFFQKVKGEWKMSKYAQYQKADFTSIHDKSEMKENFGSCNWQTLLFESKQVSINLRSRYYFFRN